MQKRSRHSGAISRLGLQRQLLALRDMGADVYVTSVFTWLLVRVDLSTGWCHDRIETLVKESGCGASSVEKSIRWLKDRGVIDVQRNETPTTGGARGSAWSWRRRVLPFDQWKSPRVATPSSEGTGTAREEEEPSPHDRRALASSVHISSPKGEREGRAPNGRAPSSPSGNEADPMVYTEVLKLKATLSENGLGPKARELWFAVYGGSPPYDLTDDDLMGARDLLENALKAHASGGFDGWLAQVKATYASSA